MKYLLLSVLLLVGGVTRNQASRLSIIGTWTNCEATFGATSITGNTCLTLVFNPDGTGQVRGISSIHFFTWQQGKAELVLYMREKQDQAYNKWLHKMLHVPGNQDIWFGSGTYTVKPFSKAGAKQALVLKDKAGVSYTLLQ